ncbi:MAG: hypothetical protein M1816_006456 [Peltula sp. TS41687]|nr:MAG: hypothetical protein M1816_006456 [Peltula sp. TS41687]
MRRWGGRENHHHSVWARGGDWLSYRVTLGVVEGVDVESVEEVNRARLMAILFEAVASIILGALDPEKLPASLVNLCPWPVAELRWEGDCSHLPLNEGRPRQVKEGMAERQERMRKASRDWIAAKRAKDRAADIGRNDGESVAQAGRRQSLQRARSTAYRARKKANARREPAYDNLEVLVEAIDAHKRRVGRLRAASEHELAIRVEQQHVSAVQAVGPQVNNG